MLGLFNNKKKEKQLIIKALQNTIVDHPIKEYLDLEIESEIELHMFTLSVVWERMVRKNIIKSRSDEIYDFFISSAETILSGQVGYLPGNGKFLETFFLYRRNEYLIELNQVIENNRRGKFMFPIKFYSNVAVNPLQVDVPVKHYYNEHWEEVALSDMYKMHYNNIINVIDNL